MFSFHNKIYGKQHRRVVFILAGWGIKQWMMAIPAVLLKRKGFQCIVYTYDGGDLTNDLQKIPNEFFQVRDSVLTSIKSLKKQGHEEFAVFGTSLGTIPALLVANKSPEISKIIINSSGSNLVEAVWGWTGAMSSIKSKLINLGYTKEKVKEALSEMMPEHNISNIQNKKILFFYAKNDGLIPPIFAQDLASKLSLKKNKIEISVNKHVGHFLATTVNLLKSQILADFLNS